VVQGIRAIFFDLDGTLVDRAGAFERYLAALRQRHPRCLADERALQMLRALDDEGRRERGSFCRAVVSRLPQLGLSAEQFWEDFAAGLVQAVRPRPAVNQLLAALSGRFRLGVISNGGGQRQRAKLARAGLNGWFAAGEIFISEEVGVEKPDRRIFLFALRQVGLPPEQVLFVGDEPARDVAGAHAAGMPACWVSHGRSYPPVGPAPRLTVERVELLAQHLEPPP
jgi:putative hydrolase of the HAD superfamily